MADKPSIYAHCKAGCLWETAHKEDVDAKAPAHILSDTDITAGSTALANGQLYLVYE